VARKGDLKPFKHLNIGLDQVMSAALEESALRNERRLTEEARYAIRQYLKIDLAPAEESASVPA
jgi:hypothetical protein